MAVSLAVAFGPVSTGWLRGWGLDQEGKEESSFSEEKEAKRLSSI